MPISAPSSNDIQDEVDGGDEPEAPFDDLVPETSLNDPHVTLFAIMNAVAVTASRSSQHCDHLYRSLSEPFNSQSLYEFVAHCKKATKKRDDRGNADMTDGNADVNGESEAGRDADAATDGTIPSSQSRGRRRLARGDFTDKHDQKATHLPVHLSSPAVPVVLGPTVPHPAKSDEAKESWSRVILILFKPRRTALNLKSTSESWTSAFGHTSFIDKLQQIMENFIVLHECKDAKHADLSIRFNMNNGSMEDSEAPSQRQAHSDDGDDETPNYK